MIFESHAHYDDSKFDDDREELLSSMQENGIEKIINIGCSIESCKSTLELTKQYPFVYGAMGIHPSDIGDLNEDTFLWLREQVKKEKVVAVGEIGLDYYWDKEEEVQKNQRIWFRRQLELAKESNLPVIIHSRDAAADTMEIMKEAYVQGIKGVIHCFSYSKEQAQEYVKMGYYIGVGGVVTFKNGKKLKSVVEAIPLTSIVLETDCPYLAPEPNRGKRNESAYIQYVAEEIARLKGISVEEVLAQTEINAKQVYQLGDDSHLIL